MASVNVKQPWYKNKGPKGIEQSNNVAASDCVHKIPTKPQFVNVIVVHAHKSQNKTI